MRQYFKTDSNRVKNDITAGITTSLAMIPEVVAFAFVLGIDPLVALSGAFMVGLIAAIFGGRPGLISGAAGAVAVVLIDLLIDGNARGLDFKNPVENMGYFYLLATVVLMGVIQILAGLFKLGRFVRLITHPVMMGFVNGLAIVIFLAQLKMFFHKTPGEEPILMQDAELYSMIGLVALTMLIVYLLPRFKYTKKLPAALTAILIVSLIKIFGNINVTTVGSYIREGGGKGLKGEFPTPNLELWEYLPFSLDTLAFIAPYAALAAAVGLIESLMTLNLVDEITETRGDGNRECVAQGAANIFSGLFGGTAGCGMIGQTMININSGGRGRMSGIVMAVTLLIFILFADTYIEMVPIAALVGVMFMMVIETFAWSSFRILKRIPKSDAFVLIAVSTITVFVDLAIAVLAGVVISALVFAWESAKHVRVKTSIKENGTKLYEVWGSVFFGSIQSFNERFDVNNDPQNVEIDFMEAKVADHSALEAIFVLVEKYEEQGKKLILKHLSSECKALMRKASPKLEAAIEESIDDPRYHVMAKVMK